MMSQKSTGTLKTEKQEYKLKHTQRTRNPDIHFKTTKKKCIFEFYEEKTVFYQKKNYNLPETKSCVFLIEKTREVVVCQTWDVLFTEDFSERLYMRYFTKKKSLLKPLIE
ncbi:hypothetical protein ACFFRR_004466 [Megaselia abdita]